METPLSTQIKNIFEKALAEHKTTIHFEYYNSRYIAAERRRPPILIGGDEFAKTAALIN